MRCALLLALLGASALALPAAAETRIFVVANAPDGYGVDHCLATGGGCGRPIANAYCQSRAFDRAASFRKLAAAELTSATPVLASASPSQADFVAIECAR